MRDAVVSLTEKCNIIKIKYGTNVLERQFLEKNILDTPETAVIL